MRTTRIRRMWHVNVYIYLYMTCIHARTTPFLYIYTSECACGDAARTCAYRTHPEVPIRGAYPTIRTSESDFGSYRTQVRIRLELQIESPDPTPNPNSNCGSNSDRHSNSRSGTSGVDVCVYPEYFTIMRNAADRSNHWSKHCISFYEETIVNGHSI